MFFYAINTSPETSFSNLQQITTSGVFPPSKEDALLFPQVKQGQTQKSLSLPIRGGRGLFGKT